MKYSIITLFLIFTTRSLTAQNDSKTTAQPWCKEVTATIKTSMAQRTVEPLEQLLASGRFPDSAQQFYIHGATAETLWKIHKKYLWDTKRKHAAIMQDSIVRRILEEHDRAIAACHHCALFGKFRRYKFLDKIKAPDNIRDKHLSELKAAGFKPDIQAPGIGVFYLKGRGTQWLGAEIAAFSMLSPSWSLKQRNAKTGKRQKVYTNTPSAASFLCLSYARMIEKPVHELSLSLFQITSPIVLNITRVGFYKAKDHPLNTKVFYRPEIGVGFGRFSASYAYNITARSVRDKAPTHCLYVRFFTPTKSKPKTS